MSPKSELCLAKHSHCIVPREYKAFDLLKKYKTEMCRNWENGECHYGSNCVYAHGRDELKEKSLIPLNYKTKRCNQFFNLGYCTFGHRCRFLHYEERPKRLPIFEKLSNQLIK